MPRLKWQLYTLALVAVVLADRITKMMAVQQLEFGETTRVLGGMLPLTLTFNQGAAFSMHVGALSRWFFMATNLLAFIAITVLYHRTAGRHRMQLAALALLASGAVGNLIDRVRWGQGVVDFIGPINLGFMYWPVFNVADSAITSGAVLLALALWRGERTEASVEAAD